MKQFTKYQIDEIIPLIEIRRDTIEDDPDSADDFETTESLDELERKIEANTMDFTENEKARLRGYLETRLNIAYGNLNHEEAMEIKSYIASMNNALSKIN